MIDLKLQNKEVSIIVQLKQEIGEKPKIYLEGEGDLLHHLIEGVFEIVDRLARMETIGHSSQEWRGK